MLVRSKSICADRHEADGQHDVVDVGDHGAERELPFEPEPEIDQDARRSRASGRACRRPAVRRTRAVRPPRRGDIRRLSPSAPRTFCTAACCAASPPGCSATRISTSAGPPNCCSCTSPRPRPPSVARIAAMSAGPDFGLHFQQRAALEIDAEIQPVGEEQRDRDDRQHRRDRKADAAKAHEVELGVVRHDPQRRQPAEAC